MFYVLRVVLMFVDASSARVLDDGKKKHRDPDVLLTTILTMCTEADPKWLEGVEAVVYDFRDSLPLFNYGAKFFHLRGFLFSDYFGTDCPKLVQLDSDICICPKVVRSVPMLGQSVPK